MNVRSMPDSIGRRASALLARASTLLARASTLLGALVLSLAAGCGLLSIRPLSTLWPKMC